MSVLERLLRWPKALLGVTLLLSLLLSPLLRRLNLHGDLLDLLPRSSKAAQAFAAYSKHMVASQELVVFVTCSDPNTLTEFAEKYSQELAKLADVPGTRTPLRPLRTLSAPNFSISSDSIRSISTPQSFATPPWMIAS